MEKTAKKICNILVLRDSLVFDDLLVGFLVAIAYLTPSWFCKAVLIASSSSSIVTGLTR